MMKNFTFIIALIALLLGGSANAQVTGVYTDFNGFWASNSTTLNPVKPENYHLLLGFTSNGVTYSTGIDDDAILNAQLGSSNFTSMKFRALPIVSVPNTAPNGVLYYVGFGQLADGIDDGATDPTTLFSPNPSSAELASYLTDGKKGLDLSTGLTNIPSGSTVRLNLSSNGITLGSIGDGVPDLLVTQMAVPSTGGTDKIKFIDSGGGLVGSEITMTMSNDTNFPIVGKWYGDFFDLAAKPQQVRREKPIKFFAIELSQLGITSSNYQDAVALVYTPGGTSDPAFIAYNEPSIGVASKIGITSSSISTDCEGNITDITIELQDSFDDPVEQSGFVITATITTGPGQLLGTLTKTTNASGQAVF
ncbi:MAG TPA: hypothetical protein VFM82_01805, partial [Flavobacteriaceae bacterium]|nr:hypothetical protein [Flavobacteriaceae bacterium]